MISPEIESKELFEAISRAPVRTCKNMHIHKTGDAVSKKRYRKFQQKHHPDKSGSYYGTTLSQFISACAADQDLDAYFGVEPDKNALKHGTYRLPPPKQRRSPSNHASSRSHDATDKPNNQVPRPPPTTTPSDDDEKEEIRKRRNTNHRNEEKRQNEERKEKADAEIQGVVDYLKEQLESFGDKYKNTKPSANVKKLGATILLSTGYDLSAMFLVANGLKEPKNTYQVIQWIYDFLNDRKTGTPERAAQITGCPTPSRGDIERMVRDLNGTYQPRTEKARRSMRKNGDALDRLRRAHERGSATDVTALSKDDLLDALVYELRHMFRSTVDAVTCAQRVADDEFVGLGEECDGEQVLEVFQYIWNGLDGHADLQNGFKDRIQEASTLFWMPEMQKPRLPDSKYIEAIGLALLKME
jgi:hypothetical protein